MSTCMTPSAADMQALWKLSRYYEPMRCDCEVTRTDAINLDSLLSLEMRSWYASMLTRLEGADLPLTDVTDLLSVTPVEGGLAAAIPEKVMRVVTVEVEGWTSPARIVTGRRDTSRSADPPQSAGEVSEAAPRAGRRDART